MNTIKKSWKNYHNRYSYKRVYPKNNCHKKLLDFKKIHVTYYNCFSTEDRCANIRKQLEQISLVKNVEYKKNKPLKKGNLFSFIYWYLERNGTISDVNIFSICQILPDDWAIHCSQKCFLPSWPFFLWNFRS